VLDSMKISGFAVLFIGAAVLLFTFYNAYLFLFGASAIPISTDFSRAFGEALAPLIETCIRAIYLGIMGWIGSILTRRGVQIVTAEREESKLRKMVKETEAETKTEAQSASEAGEKQG